MRKYFLIICIALTYESSIAGTHNDFLYNLFNVDTVPVLKYPIYDRWGDPYSANHAQASFDFKKPSNITDSVVYDNITKKYIIYEKLGTKWYRNPNYLTFDEYTKYVYRKQEESYFQSRNQTMSILNRNVSKPKLNIKKSFFSRLFGSDSGKPKVEIRPFGNMDLFVGFNRQTTLNPALPERSRKTGGFEFKPDFNVNLNAKIGNNFNLPIAYNTLQNFGFQDQIKLDYAGTVDQTLRQFQAGNTSFTSRGTLIPSVQSIFGVKTALQFGKLTATVVLGNQRGSRQSVNTQGGLGSTTFDIKADDYEENRHFLLGQYFKDNYNTALKDLPLIRSQIQIQRIEVWVTNRNGATTETRDVVALTDLGERVPYNWSPSPNTPNATPDNKINSLYSTLSSNGFIRKPSEVLSVLLGNNLKTVQDFEKTFARKLSPQEYQFNSQLGTLSLQQQLQADEVLGVAYQYTLNGKLFQVGEFSTDVPPDSSNATQKILILKLLKATSQRPTIPIWDLMMKNVYPVGGGNVQRQDFKFQVFYNQPNQGTVPFLPQADVAAAYQQQILLSQLNLDKLNNNNDPQPDGQFDFIENVTINSSYGRIMFPVLEPFGNDIKYVFNSAALADQYAYTELYDSIKVIAQLFPNKNRFTMAGSSKGSGTAGEIYLNGINIPQGSVTATINGIKLVENQDYTIDYNAGVLRIINQSILASGQNVSIQYENQANFGFQTKSFTGLRLDYVYNKNLSFGGNLVRLKEQPFFVKTLINEDPINNLMYGVDGNFQKNLPKLNKYLNKLPNYNPSSPSSINVYAEVAGIKPGSPKQVQNQVYIDDFEGTRSGLDLRFPAISWALASTPQGSSRFPEATLINNLDYGKNRAKIAWYQIDQNLQTINDPNNPLGTNRNELSKPETRKVFLKEIFPLRSSDIGFADQIVTTFDVSFFPKERGPYNFDAAAGSVSATDGSLLNPKARWGGLMRQIDQTDFETNNVEFIEFWLQDPFSRRPNRTEGKLFFNLGNISEDILKDSRRFYENGLATTNIPAPVDPSGVWGRVPQNPIQVNNAFPSTPTDREQMDVGFDGLSDTAEANKFTPYLNNLTSLMGANNPNLARFRNDPSGDNFVYYRDGTYNNTNAGIIERYKNFNGTQGNSKSSGNSQLIEAATLYPDNEDLNRDNTLNEVEEYFEYEVDIKKNMPIGTNFIVDKKVVPVSILPNNASYNETWYLFRIPITTYTRKVGQIPDFKSIRFIRMYTTDFDDTVNLRFAKLELVRNQWRTFKYKLNNNGLFTPATGAPIIGAVNIEENENRSPVPYVLPCDLRRQQDVSTNNQVIQINEQSISLRFNNLADNDNRAIIKTFNYDLRQYKRLKMFAHLEGLQEGIPLNKNDINAVVRIGNDYINNYYEIKYPLNPTSVPPTDNKCETIWPSTNDLDLRLELLTEIKSRRQNLGSSYSETINGITYTVYGAPNLGEVKGILLGIENPSGAGMSSVTGEVWFNELRLSGLDNDGGIAANARIDLQASDLARISIAANHVGRGFGNLEQRVQERARDAKTNIDANLSIEFGKLLPRTLNVSLPVNATFSQEIKVPEYDPYDKDLKYKQKLRSSSNKDSTRDAAIEQRTVKTITISNAGFKGTPKKKRIYNPSNFDVSYSYRKEEYNSPLVENDELIKHRGVFAYNYNPDEKSLEPFKKIIKSKSKWLDLIRDINFNPFPNTLTFRGELDRQFGAFRARNTVVNNFKLKETYNKYFTFTRLYNMRWNPMKSITIEFNAVDSARIDEPFGRLDGTGKKQVWDNIKKGGRNTNYYQTANASYKLPTNKFPLLDWTSISYSYNTTYRWITASRLIPEFGNTLENNLTQRWSGDLFFDQLYNKVKFLRLLDGGSASKQEVKTWRENRKQQLEELKKNNPGKKVKLPKDPNKPLFISQALKAVAKIATSLKNIHVEYGLVGNTRLPGFLDSARALGNNFKTMNPGLDFVFGRQPDTNWVANKAKQGQFSKNADFNYLNYQSYDQTLDITGVLEPFRDLRIDLNMKKTFNKNVTSLFKDVSGTGNNFAQLNPLTAGTYDISFISVNTLFEKSRPDVISPTFKQFQNNRLIVSRRLGLNNIYSGNQSSADGYANGYNRYAQDVLLPSFIAAYTKKDANGIALIDQRSSNVSSNPFKNIRPLPNWKLSYNGLTNIRGVDKIFSAFTLNHAYTGNLSMNSFTSALAYQDILGIGVPSFQDPVSGNFIPYFLVPNVTITENFGPLAGIQFTTTNKISGSFDYKKSRTLSLSLIDYQLLENKSEEIAVSIQWEKRGLRIPFIKSLPKWLNKSGGQKLENNIKFGFDFSIRDNFTFNSRLDQENSYTTNGQKEISIVPSLDYVINNRINIRLFYDRRVIRPYISVPPPTIISRGGVQIRIGLQ